MVPVITTASSIKVTCKVDEVPMMLKDVCVTNNTAYCKTYVANTTSCPLCLDTYWLKRDGSNAIVSTRVCEAIATSLNCVTWDETNNICSVCKSGYILYNIADGFGIC